MVRRYMFASPPDVRLIHQKRDTAVIFRLRGLLHAGSEPRTDVRRVAPKSQFGRRAGELHHKLRRRPQRPVSLERQLSAERAPS
jgi:hypothetical protein